MNEYINELVNGLYRTYGFNIIEIKDVPGVISKWGLYVLDGNTGNFEVMVFSNLNSYYKIDTARMYSDLNRIYGYSKIKFTILLIDDSRNIPENYIYSGESYPQCGLILISSSSNKILYSNRVSADILYRIASCMDKSIELKNKDNQFNFRGAEITYLLVALNIIFYIITAVLSGNLFTSNINVLVFMGAKVNSLISSGQYYRLLSCMFLHGGIVHLAFNMYALVVVGPLVESVYGKLRYIFIYFFSGIAASFLSYVFSPHVSIGASGAIFGLLGATLMFALEMKKKISKEYIYNILSVIALNLIFGFSASNIDNFGHIGGLLGGIISSRIVIRKISNNSK
ncbi:rhomboid family intramembrane serine protease [Clostridium sp. LBM24168]